jgi:glutamate--cysteine ligase
LGRDETHHLEPLDRTIEAGQTPAEEILAKFNGHWHGSVEPAYDEYAF